MMERFSPSLAEAALHAPDVQGQRDAGSYKWMSIPLGYLVTSRLVRSPRVAPGGAADLARAVAEGGLTTDTAVKTGDSSSLMAQRKVMQPSLVSVGATK